MKRGADGIDAGQKVGNIVFTRRVGRYRAREISLSIDDRDRASDDGAAGLIGDAAKDTAGITLRKELLTSRKNKEAQRYDPNRCFEQREEKIAEPHERGTS